MSTYLDTRAKTGDRLFLNGPFGRFDLRAPRWPILFLGGTGVGPILSKLEHRLRGVISKGPCDSFTERAMTPILWRSNGSRSSELSRYLPMTPVQAMEASIH